ncbi:uncharacterized protein SCDLUD_004390 [Saccharomycodes ludwigii]|uniref:uncharacterized protein n=1 Tax=Saccharomycodes ludwigii TaxID=36035 RepID=UPI001E87CCD0|nr:hypothetical protein SCDLUD_004390 [Saccharomycodes ludwigii]KAH3900071.1 hypothetical protein SCDLUD_004390 [Saccharomycodes ludwigii]
MSKVENKNNRQVLVRTPEDIKENFTYLDIITRVDNFPVDYFKYTSFNKHVYQLKAHDDTFEMGFVLHFVIELMQKECSTLFHQTFELNDSSRVIKFKSPSFSERNKLIMEIGMELRRKDSLNCLRGWRNELYVVYDTKKSPYLLIERALSGVFGVVTYGIHCNGYLRDPEAGIKFWIPRRSASKATWPLMYDNIVAGGLGYPFGIMETLYKECGEEASFSKEIVQSYSKSVGVVSYFDYGQNILKDKYDSEASFITGEFEYLFDMELPASVIPKPNDEEVDSFGLYTLQETIDLLKTGNFKPNCALITVEFLIRHGYITPENEPNYAKIVNKIHRTLPFPTN